MQETGQRLVRVAAPALACLASQWTHRGTDTHISVQLLVCYALEAIR